MQVRGFIQKDTAKRKEQEEAFAKRMGMDLKTMTKEEKAVFKEEARSTIAKSIFNWENVKNAKVRDKITHAAKPMFTNLEVWREKNLSWLLGHTEKFIKQVRYEVAVSLAQQKMIKHPNLNEEEVIASYEKKLEGMSLPELLKVRKQAYITKEEDIIAGLNERHVKAAILALNAKCLNGMNKPLPAGEGEEQQAFIEDFIKRSRVFNEKGGRDRVISHESMEDALIDYITKENVKYKLDEKQSGILQYWQLEEMKEVAKLIDSYDKSLDMHIETEKATKIINLWQEKVGHKKSLLVKENRYEIEEFVLDAYSAGSTAALEAHDKYPRKKGESVSDYGDRLINIIEKVLKGNEAAKLAYGSQYYAILLTETDSRDKECLIKVGVMLKKIKRWENETREQYINRAFEEVKSKIDSSDTAMQNAASLVLSRFSIDQETLQASESAFEEISKNEIYKSFNDREKLMFNNMFSNRVGKLSSNKQQDWNEVLEVAVSVLNEIKESKEAAITELYRRQFILNQIIFNYLETFEKSISYNDEKPLYKRQPYGKKQLTLEQMLIERYGSFTNSDSNLKGFLNDTSGGNILPNSDQVISGFKKYLNEDRKFRSVLDELRGFGTKESQSLLQKLMDKFDIKVQENPIKGLFKRIFVVETKPEEFVFIDNPKPMRPPKNSMQESLSKDPAVKPKEEIKKAGALEFLRNHREKLILNDEFINKKLSTKEQGYYKEGIPELAIFNTFQGILEDAYDDFIQEYIEKAPIDEKEFDFKAFDREFKNYLQNDEDFMDEIKKLELIDNQDYRNFSKKLRDNFLPHTNPFSE